MVRGEKELARLARNFVCIRVTNMQGVDLGTFQFDYDVTWAAFLMNGEGRIYSRYFGRNETGAMSHLSMDGFVATIKAALELHKREARLKPESRPDVPWKTVDDIPMFKKTEKGKNCIHCHQVYDYQRMEAFATGKYDPRSIWTYPPPENWGLVVDNVKVKQVKPGSIADKSGLRAGDVIRQVNDVRIVSVGDLFFAIHNASGEAKVTYARDGKEAQATLKLEGDWRKSDLSWRASLRATEPRPGFWGQELTPDEKKKAGVAEAGLAVRVAGVEPGRPAAQAGVKPGDILVGVGTESRAMTERQLQAWFRVNLRPGDRVTVKVLRNGRTEELTLSFPK